MHENSAFGSCSSEIMHPMALAHCTVHSHDNQSNTYTLSVNTLVHVSQFAKLFTRAVHCEKCSARANWKNAPCCFDECFLRRRHRKRNWRVRVRESIIRKAAPRVPRDKNLSIARRLGLGRIIFTRARAHTSNHHKTINIHVHTKMLNELGQL